MIILGINSNHADSSACLIKNGKLLCAIEEERINRIKHWSGIPLKSIELCLKSSNIKFSDVDHIALNTNPKLNFFKKLNFFFKNFFFGKKKLEIFDRYKKKLSLKKEISKYFSNNNFKLHYIDHHLSHIASAFYASGFKKANGLSIDGFGDFESINIAECDKNNIKIIDKVFFPNSLGVFYEAMTQLVGFKNYGEEYKFMGLAPYGKPKYFDIILNKLFIHKNEKFELNLDYFNHTNKNFKYLYKGIPNQNFIFKKKIYEIFNEKKIKEKKFNQLKKDIASSAQKVFEFFLIEICKSIKNRNFSDKLVYAGGCALNSSANNILYKSKLFKKIYIPYSSGDSGGSIGAALYLQKKINKNVKFSNLKNPYIGPKYKLDEIELILKKNNVKKKFTIKKILDQKKLCEIIAKDIKNNKIVGFFQNNMEFGARALGNRSILANPCNKKIKDIINLKIKKRENFRPFAPSILEDKKKQWYGNKSENNYMTYVENVRENKKKLIQAVTHIDGTGRVQTVSKKLNPTFYQLIYSFYKLTSVPILLNTSFNENEPIVMKPQEAYECFNRTNMDILVLGPYIIKR